MKKFTSILLIVAVLLSIIGIGCSSTDKSTLTTEEKLKKLISIPASSSERQGLDVVIIEGPFSFTGSLAKWYKVAELNPSDKKLKQPVLEKWAIGDSQYATGDILGCIIYDLGQGHETDLRSTSYPLRILSGWQSGKYSWD